VLRPSQLPGRAACQLPDQSTIIRVRSSLTDSSRPWGARSISPIVVATGVSPGCMLKSRLRKICRQLHPYRYEISRDLAAREDEKLGIGTSVVQRVFKEVQSRWLRSCAESLRRAGVVPYARLLLSWRSKDLSAGAASHTPQPPLAVCLARSPRSSRRICLARVWHEARR
jgi:hypothetical protein